MQGGAAAAVLMASGDLDAIEPELSRLDALLQPIAHRPIAFERLPELARNPPVFRPLDEAGIRAEAEALVDRLLRYYESADDAGRDAARRLLGRHRAFCWAARPKAPRDTAEGLRAHLLHVSLVDQASDPRDEILRIRHLCAKARAAGIDPSPILREVAALSSNENRYHMGSTREFLLQSA